MDDRDAFIRECVRALEGLAVGQSGADDADDATAELYDRLSFDFPDLSAGELARVLAWVCKALRGGDRASLCSRATDGRLHPVLGLVLGAGEGCSGPAGETWCGASRDPASALATVFDTLKEKAQSSSSTEDAALWQQLYGAHVFGLLAHGPEGLVWGLLESPEGAISYQGLTNESTWTGVFVPTIKDALHRLVHGTGAPGTPRRREAAFGVLEALVLGTQSSTIATVVFEMLFDVCGSGGRSSVGVRAARVRVSRMVAAACLADGRLVSLDTAKRALFDLVDLVEPTKPVLERSTVATREMDEQRSMVLMAGGVLLEHVVHQQLKRGGSKSVRQSFEEEMVRRGLWGVLVSSMVSFVSSADSAPESERDAATRTSLARGLVMASAYSPELHAWAIRVPGYAAVWARRSDKEVDEVDQFDTAVLRAAWSALSMDVDGQAPRHVRFLREVFCGRSADKLTEAGGLPTLEMVERLCWALEVQGGGHDTGSRDTVERIEAMRVVVRERILAAERARVIDEDKQRRLSTLPEVERLRHVDRMLKGLCAVAVTVAVTEAGRVSSGGKLD